MKTELREICGDWALDIYISSGKERTTIFLNSRQNAQNIKRILEVDDSVKNHATVCDMKEIVRCSKCKWSHAHPCCRNGMKTEELWCMIMQRRCPAEHFFCAYGEKE